MGFADREVVWKVRVCLLLTVSGLAPVRPTNLKLRGYSFEESRRKAETTCSFELTMDEQMASRPLRCMFGAKDMEPTDSHMDGGATQQNKNECRFCGSNTVPPERN